MVSADTDFFKKVDQVDAVIGGDHGKGKLRMILMVLLRTNNPDDTIRKRFIVGKIECKKDTSDVLEKSLMKEQNEAMKAICEDKIFFVTTNPSTGEIRLRFASSVIEPGGRMFQFGHLYAVIWHSMLLFLARIT